MFKIGEIKMSELAGTAFPELAGREGLLYGVSDPEAPESNSMIYVRTEVADSYTKVRDSIFVTKEEVELPRGVRADGSIDEKELEPLMPWSKDLPAECYKRRK